MTTAGARTVILAVAVFRYAIAVQDAQIVRLYVRAVWSNAKTVQAKSVHIAIIVKIA